MRKGLKCANLINYRYVDPLHSPPKLARAMEDKLRRCSRDRENREI